MKLDPDYHSTLSPEGRLTIDLPGTDSWTDMIANLRIGRRKVHGCRVNRLDRAEAIYVIRALRTQIEQASEIHIYGHSRGGAIALQIAFEIPVPPTHVTVTAAKPTGDELFCRLFKAAKALRQCGDIVPFLPPWQPNIRHRVFGKWQPFWKAHAVRNYRQVKL